MAMNTRVAAPPEDRTLVLAFQSGDREAYEAIFRRHSPLVERICRRYLINKQDAEEATQETMLRVFRSLPSFNGRYALRAWVARIATNVCLDQLRQQSRNGNGNGNGKDSTIPLGELSIAPAAEGTDPAELLDRLNRTQEIYSHLKLLPERHRVALVLREVEGMSHREIAQALDTTPGRVKALLHRARKGFRQTWMGERPLVLVPFGLAASWMRRLFGKMNEVGTAATRPELTATVTAGEHIPTAVAAVVLAGTLGLGAAITPASDPAVPKETADVVVLDVPADTELKPRAVQGEKSKERSAPAAAAPAPEPSIEPPENRSTAEVEAAAVQIPEPEPPKAVRPPPPTAPAGFTFSFISDWSATTPCQCPESGQVIEEVVRTSAGELESFSTTITGALRDSTGQPGWPVDVVQSGTGSDHQLTFYVETQSGTHTYTGTATALGRERTSWGGWKYAFSGAYEWRGGPIEATPLPQRGTYSVSLTFAVREGRIVEAAFALADKEEGGVRPSPSAAPVA